MPLEPLICRSRYKNVKKSYKNRKKFGKSKKTIITYKAHNGQGLPLPRYYKTKIYTDDQRQLLWLYAEDEGTKWVKGFKVIAANTVNKDYYERLLKEKNENGIGLHGDDIEEIERKKAINRMNKLQNLTNRRQRNEMGKRIRSDRSQHGEQRLLRKITQRKK